MKANEDRLQADAYRWFHNTYPHLRGLLCYNLNNVTPILPPDAKAVLKKYGILEKVFGMIKKAAAYFGMVAKAMGLQKGRSDMVLYLKGRAFMIEWKTEKGKQHGKQKEWQSLVESQGFSYYIVRSVDEFKELVTVLISSYD
jgi:hypothetical protein